MENVTDVFPPQSLAIELYPLLVNRTETDLFPARNIDGGIEITEEPEAQKGWSPTTVVTDRSSTAKQAAE